MPTLGEHANNILGMLGYLPDCMVDLEDAANAFLRARKLYWQQLGMSSMDLKVTSSVIDLSAQIRDFALDSSLADVFPAFVEIELTGANGRRLPVDVIPLEDVIQHEGEYALSIYSNRIRLAWDAWQNGRLYLFYDPSAAIANVSTETVIDFPAAFLDMIEYKSAWSLVSVAQGKEAAESYRQQRPVNAGLITTLKDLKGDFAIQVTQWENEFRIWRLTANEERSYERRSDSEIPSTRGDNFSTDDVNEFVGIG